MGSSSISYIMRNILSRIIFCTTISIVCCSNAWPTQDDILKLLLSYSTPRDGPMNITERCINEGDDYIEGITQNKTWAGLMLDSSAILPSSGLLGDQNIFHHPGSFSECLDIEDEGIHKSQYCLLTVIDSSYLPPDKRKSKTQEELEEIVQQHMESIRNEHFIPEQAALQAIARTTSDSESSTGESCISLTANANPLMLGLTKIGKCLPIGCTKKDIQYGGINFFLENAGIL